MHSNDISVAQSVRPLCEIHIGFMTTEWKFSSLLPCSSLTFPSVKIHLAASGVTTWETSSPKYFTESVIYSFVLISVILLFRYLIFISKNVWKLPSVTVNTKNLSSTLLIMSSITSCSTCETFLSSTYQAMVYCFMFMSLLATNIS